MYQKPVCAQVRFPLPSLGGPIYTCARAPATRAGSCSQEVGTIFSNMLWLETERARTPNSAPSWFAHSTEWTWCNQEATLMHAIMESASVSNPSLWAGRILSGIVVLSMIFDSVTKPMKSRQVSGGHPVHRISARQHCRHRRRLAHQHGAFPHCAHRSSGRQRIWAAPWPRMHVSAALPNPCLAIIFGILAGLARSCATPGCERSFRFGVERCGEKCGQDMCGGTGTGFECRPANCDSKTNNSRSSQSAVFDR